MDYTNILPDSTDRHARSHWASCGSKMKMHYAGDYPRNFRRVKGTMHLILDNFLEGLTIIPEEYSPIMQTLRNGDLKYEMVTPYNQKWLPRDARHKLIPEDRRVSFDPATVWVEDRWLLCRRMTGYHLCQILFYHLFFLICTHYRGSGCQNDEVAMPPFGGGRKKVPI